MRLSASSLAALPAHVARAGYDRAQASHGIVHLGIGAFHRAHQAVYTDDANAAEPDAGWTITGVSLRSAGVRDQMEPQDGLFTVTVTSAAAPQTRLIGAVGTVLVAPESPDPVIAAIAAPRTQIVTFTVTEKGYYQGADAALDIGNVALASDLAGNSPSTIYGFLEAALRARKDSGLAGLTLLSCDNLAENGKKLETLLLAFLRRRDPDLAEWCAKECRFPCSMVDRIVPATKPSDLDELATRIGLRDEAAVFTEPFRQWVIEDDFAGPRPRWEAGGAQFVDDVRPYETAKLRMLNGAHSALAYLGLAAGHEFVSEAISDPAIAPLVDRLMREEAATSFAAADGQDLGQYASDLIARFANPALAHRLAQIAMDGSQKIRQRWLETLAAHGARDADCSAILTALAAWIVHIRGANPFVDDPQAERLAGLWASEGQNGIVAALFGTGGVFADSWTPSHAARDMLQAQLEIMCETAQ